MATGFRLKGWHVLAMLVGFFVIVASVNAIFITFAMRSFPGEEVKKSYAQGLLYNDRLEARDAQNILGWTAEITRASLEGEFTTIELTFKNVSGAPVLDLGITGRIAHPVRGDHDQALVFKALGDGVYGVEIAGLNPGAWKLKAHAENSDGEMFDLETKLVLE